jgi:hypothetical protein
MLEFHLLFKIQLVCILNYRNLIWKSQLSNEKELTMKRFNVIKMSANSQRKLLCNLFLRFKNIKQGNEWFTFTDPI